jgi:hypothetical protein
MPNILSIQFSPIQATIETNLQWNSVTQVTVAKYFRDEQGRTRVEQGELVNLHDPVSGESFTLNPAKKIAIPGAPKIPGMTMPAMPQAPKVPGVQIPAAPPMPQAPQLTETASLGEKTIDGIKVSGKQISAAIPGKPPITGEVWTSKELKLPIHSTMTDPSTGAVMTTQMKAVVPGAKIDPGMFKVPVGFQITVPQVKVTVGGRSVQQHN